jgi:hypothetical protein
MGNMGFFKKEETVAFLTHNTAATPNQGHQYFMHIDGLKPLVRLELS